MQPHPPAEVPAEALPPLPAPVPHLEAKALLLLAVLLALVLGAVGYLGYARGAFEPTQRLVLVADNSEGVVVGMDVTFSGFPIGRVRRIELAPDGNARILVDVPIRDAHWLRTSSVFTLERGIVGGTNIRAFSGILSDPKLPDGAERTVLRGDASAEIPRLLASARELLQNLGALTADGAPLPASLANVQALTGRLNGPGGALGVLLGDGAQGRQVLATLGRADAVLARTDALIARVDAVAARADVQLFGNRSTAAGAADTGGAVQDARAAIVELQTLLRETRGSLKGVDAVLEEARVVGANARIASTDLGRLRAEVETSLRNAEQLIAEINRKWPFARDTELKLP